MDFKNSKFLTCVVGTQCIGKSTFIKDLCSTQQFNNMFYTDKIDYRTAIENSGLKINRNGSLEAELVIFNCMIDSLKNALLDENIHNFISDRAVLDAFVYTKYLKMFSKDSKVKNSITDYIMNNLFNLTIRYMKLYDKVIYIPLNKCDEIAVVDDKFRDTNLEYRYIIDSIFTDTFEKINKFIPNFNENLIKIWGTRDERIKMFKEKCGEFIF